MQQKKKSFRRSMFLNWRENEQPVLYTYIGVITWYRPVSSVSLLYFCMETPVISFVLSTWINDIQVTHLLKTVKEFWVKTKPLFTIMNFSCIHSKLSIKNIDMNLLFDTYLQPIYIFWMNMNFKILYAKYHALLP